jgi:hypothetical protein
MGPVVPRGGLRGPSVVWWRPLDLPPLDPSYVADNSSGMDPEVSSDLTGGPAPDVPKKEGILRVPLRPLPELARHDDPLALCTTSSYTRRNCTKMAILHHARYPSRAQGFLNAPEVMSPLNTSPDLQRRPVYKPQSPYREAGGG